MTTETTETTDQKIDALQAKVAALETDEQATEQYRVIDEHGVVFRVVETYEDAKIYRDYLRKVLDEEYGYVFIQWGEVIHSGWKTQKDEDD